MDREPTMLRLRKRDLPVALVIEDDDGNRVIQSLEPAGKWKLGACVRHAHEHVKEWIERKLGRR
jgi:hypothetical protein